MLKNIRADLYANTRKFGAWVFFYSLFLSPGFLTVFFYRISAQMQRFGIWGKILAKILWRVNILVSGCHISPKAIIGPGLRLPHPIGVVIGESVKVGRDVVIYQNCTLGVDEQEKAKYPIIGDDVTIYAGAVIAGGVMIGDRCIIGANAFVKKNVPSGFAAVGIPARIISQKVPRETG